MTRDEYFNIRAISATALKAGARSMREMREVMGGGEREATDAMTLGTALHMALLEPEKADIVVYEGRRAGGEWKAFEAVHENRLILTGSQRDSLDMMLGAADGNKRIMQLLTNIEAETTIAWSTGDRACKAKIDAYQPATATLIDVKTMARIDERSFGRAVYDTGIDIQLAWYRRGLRAVGCAVDTSYIIAISNAQPDAVAIRIPGGVLDSADRKIDGILAQWRRACETGVYGGVYGDAEEVTFIPPLWAVEEMDMTTEEGSAAEL